MTNVSPSLLGPLFGVEEVPELGPRCNVSPTQEAPIVRVAETRGPRRLEGARWGLVPSWAKDPSIGDLCRMTGASERSVHLAFREHIGSSPKAYRKVLLLNAARADLRSARAGATVTSVAVRWGFVHAGWFAHDYKAMFGESPRETLHRRALSRRGPGPRVLAVSG